MIGLRLLTAEFPSPVRVFGIRNGSFETWTDGVTPDEWVLTSTATNFGWNKNTNALYVSDGVASLNTYRVLTTTALSGTVAIEQTGINVDTSTYTKLLIDIKRVNFGISGYDQDIYFSAGLHSESLGDLVSVSYNWWYGLSSSSIPSQITLTIPSKALNTILTDVSLWIDVEFEVSATKFNSINCIMDNIRFA